MDIDLDSKLKDTKGRTIVCDEKSDTLGDLLYHIVTAPASSDPKDVTGKRKLFALSNKFGCGGKASIDKDEIELIRNKAAEVLHTLAFAAVDELLDEDKVVPIPANKKKCK